LGLLVPKHFNELPTGRTVINTFFAVSILHIVIDYLFLFDNCTVGNPYEYSKQFSALLLGTSISSDLSKRPSTVSISVSCF
jgi:hypothetical protein